MTSKDQGSFLTPGGSFAAPEPGELSSLLDGYEVSELIACGGMGAVYRARQVGLDRQVAIKVLPRELSRFEEFKKGFRTEARAMAKLNHPNLVGVHDFGEVDEMPYLVMEYVDGASLFQAKDGDAVNALYAVRIVAGIAEGLGHAHKQGVLHRDIKTANILIAQDFTPKLADFGLAVPSGDVGSGLNMGTPGYMAPEVARDFRAATPASDVYSLGVVLHEMLTGVTPTDETPPKLELVPRRRGLAQLVQKATAREAYMRYSDGEEMAKALHKWLADAEKVPLHVITAAESAATPRPVVHPRPVLPKRPTGTGGSVIAIVGIAALLLVGVFAFGKGGCDNKNQDEGTDFHPDDNEDTQQAGESAPPTKPDFDVEGHKSEICGKLMAALNRHIEAKRANFARLKARAGPGEGWEAYFALADEKRGRLPRFLSDDHKIVIDENMAALFTEFAVKEQAALEKDHLAEMRRIHGDSETIMAKEAPGKMPPWVADNLISWLEWLGVDLLEIFDFDPAGVWKSWSTPQGDPVTTITIRNDGTHATISEGDREEPGRVTPEGGRLTVIRASDQRTWPLSLRPPFLDLLDEKAELLSRFQRRPYAFMPNKKAENFKPEEPVPPEPWTRFEDQELAERNQAFYRALELELSELRNKLLVEPLQEEVKKAATVGDPARAGEIHGAIKQAKELDWEKVLLDEGELERIAVPPDLQGIRKEFDRAMKGGLKSPKVEGYQEAWVKELMDFKARWTEAGKDVDEIEVELQRWPPLAGNEVGVKERAKGIPEDAHKRGGHRYKIFVTEKIRFDEAKKACENFGGYLVTFEDREEQEFIAGLQQGGALWIGGTDKEDEGEFRWLDGTPVLRGKLNCSLRGNNMGRDYLHLTRDGRIGCRPESGFLSDGAHKWVEGYVCEWDQ